MTASKLARDRARGLFLSTFEKETILTKVKIINNEYITVDTKDWDSYWQSVCTLGNEELNHNLEMLYASWVAYLHSSSGKDQRREYCYRYFSFLDSLFSHRLNCDVDLWRRTLKITLGFECFGIISYETGSKIFLAGTSTMRNPCYLLAKVKHPDAIDDSRFLPFITTPEQNSAMFFHYRQYSLSVDSTNSILLYPIVDQSHRVKGMKLLNKLAGIIRYSADPWTNERGTILFRNIIKPIVEHEIRNSTYLSSIEFVDIGAGSGSLVAYLCRKILELEDWNGGVQKFRLISVDLEPSDPTRFLRDKSIRDCINSLEYIGDEYRSWLSQSKFLSQDDGLRITFISRLLDTCSEFYFSNLNQEQLSGVFGNRISASDVEESLPQSSLSEDSAGIENLVISNSHKYIGNDRIYPLLSLSQFYHGFELLYSQNDKKRRGIDAVLPSRKFNQECLIDIRGESIIRKAMQICDYLIIIDMDLIPGDLVNHLTAFSLDNITICDMTRLLRLKNNYAYVISKKVRTNGLFLKGESIW